MVNSKKYIEKANHFIRTSQIEGLTKILASYVLKHREGAIINAYSPNSEKYDPHDINLYVHVINNFPCRYKKENILKSRVLGQILAKTIEDLLENKCVECAVLAKHLVAEYKTEIDLAEESIESQKEE